MTSKEVLKKLKKSKLLIIQDNDRIHNWIRGGWAEYDSPPLDYDRNYFARLKESLGLEATIVRSAELVEEIERVDAKRAEGIADMWISEAKEMINVTREDVIRSAELYIAYKELLKKYEANAITMASWALVPDGKIKAMPPLAEMELAKELIPCCCESDVASLVTQTIGVYISGRPSFMGDMVSAWKGLRREDAIHELPKNYVAIGHCYGPINPHGNDRVPYVIRDHVVHSDLPLAKRWGKSWKGDFQARVFKAFKEKNITFVGIRVEWPVDEVVTIVKFDPYNKKVRISTGRIFDSHPYFKDFDNTACRTKMAIETDRPFKKIIGGHLVAFYGDLKGEIKDLAKLIGFEVLE